MLAVQTKIEVKEIHTCCSCGSSGTDMVRFNDYVGGRGIVEFWECERCLEHTEIESKIAVEAFRRNLWELKKLEWRRN